MSWQFYKHNDRWAIWSTVVDDWIVADLTEDELIDYYTSEKERRAREKATTYIETINSGDDPYHGRGVDESELRAREKYDDLVEMHSDS